MAPILGVMIRGSRYCGTKTCFRRVRMSNHIQQNETQVSITPGGWHPVPSLTHKVSLYIIYSNLIYVIKLNKLFMILNRRLQINDLIWYNHGATVRLLFVRRILSNFTRSRFLSCKEYVILDIIIMSCILNHSLDLIWSQGCTNFIFV